MTTLIVLLATALTLLPVPAAACAAWARHEARRHERLLGPERPDD